MRRSLYISGKARSAPCTAVGLRIRGISHWTCRSQSSIDSLLEQL